MNRASLPHRFLVAVHTAPVGATAARYPMVSLQPDSNLASCASRSAANREVRRVKATVGRRDPASVNHTHTPGISLQRWLSRLGFQLRCRRRDKLGFAQAGAGGSAMALAHVQRDVLGDYYPRQYPSGTGVFDSLGANSRPWPTVYAGLAMTI
jgi:hypothetical protein